MKANFIPQLYTLCFLIFVTMVSSCTQTQEPPLRIGTNTWPGYEPLYLARSLGYYKDTQVNLVEMTSASEVIHALRNGNLEGATLTLDESLTLLADDIDLEIILVMDFSNGADVMLVKPHIENLSKLKGKNIATEYTAVGALMLDGALTAADMSVSDVKVVSCLYDNHLNCYRDNDAVITFEPIRTKLLSLGAKQLFDSSMIPGRIVDVLVIHKETVKNHSQALKDLVDGYFKARQYLVTDPKEASKSMALRQNISPDEVLASFYGVTLPTLEENHNLLNSKSAQLISTAETLVSHMVKQKLLRKTIDVNHIINSKFLP
jgi:NitT/TauT family transport system substrate-binding protein